MVELDKGELTRKVIKVGMVGDEYTQVLSGLDAGQSVVLADYAEAVPSSNTDDEHLRRRLGGLGGGGGGFGGGGFGGGRRRRYASGVQRTGGGGHRRLTRSGAHERPRTAGRYGGPVAPIRLDQVNLVVHDVAASRAFYARLGLDFGDEPDPVWDAHHVSARHGEALPLDVDLDSETLRRQVEPGLVRRHAGPSSASRWTSRDEVDALVASLAADGVAVQQPPYDAFWGARYAVVSDPDGNGVGIMSPIDPARAATSPPPS